MGTQEEREKGESEKRKSRDFMIITSSINIIFYINIDI
jgi:hypothetical protein